MLLSLAEQHNQYQLMKHCKDNPERYNLRILTKAYEYYSVLCFQNVNGRIVSVPGHISDVDSWEKLLRKVLYEINTPIIQQVLSNPLTDWHTDYVDEF